jgi:hypothetical protein
MTSDADYLTFNPFAGDRDVVIECRRVEIVTTSKEHWCAVSTLVPPDYTEHNIPARSCAWKESAKVDGQFGSCYCCLPCLDKLMAIAS